MALGHEHKAKPTFWVGDIPVYGNKILSPMSGFSDLPYRSICRAYGSAMSYTEFVAVESIWHKNPVALKRLTYDPAERPIVFQIFGAALEWFEKVIPTLAAMSPDIIDINMGCSAQNVAGRGAGAGLLRKPQKIAAIFQRLTKLFNGPITGKIRLGWDDDSLNYLEIARVIEDNGGALVAIHGRTKRQGYRGEARWGPIAEIKQAVSIPVIGNGDVQTVADVSRMQTETGCDAVMIGRAAVGNPWIFANKDVDQVSLADRITLIRTHLAKMTNFYGPEKGVILFRKHVVKYTKGLHGGAKLRSQLMRCTTAAEFIAVVTNFETQATQYLTITESATQLPDPEPITCQRSSG